MQLKRGQIFKIDKNTSFIILQNVGSLKLIKVIILHVIISFFDNLKRNSFFSSLVQNLLISPGQK